MKLVTEKVLKVYTTDISKNNTEKRENNQKNAGFIPAFFIIKACRLYNSNKSRTFAELFTQNPCDGELRKNIINNLI